MSANETRVTKISRLTDQPAIPEESCLVQIHGPDLGKRYVLQDEEFTIGRDVENDVVLENDNVSRRHARISSRAGRYFVEDLKSTNGTFLNEEEVVGEVPLRSGDMVKVGSSIFKFLSGGSAAAVESLYHEEIYRLTIVDGLTQINNKRFFLEFLEREMGRCHRYDRALSLVIFDIDHFKKINDTHGHLAGDYVLRELAQTLQPRVRKEECFARYGGEEFAVVVPEAGSANARRFAEKMRKLVEDKPFSFEGKPIPVTISVGVADMTSEMTEPLQFIKVADANLYQAKKAGRNRVVG